MKSLFKNIFEIRKLSSRNEYILFGGLIKIKIRSKKNELISYINQLKMIVDSCCDITKCRPATGNLRLAQLIRLKALKVILKVLEDNDIKYWLDGGTLLGAVRHKGFIPWDDDIDLATDRDNYNKIKKSLKKLELETSFSINYGQDNCGYYMKIYFKDFDIADVFVYDYSDNDTEKENLYKYWLDSWKKFYRKYKSKLRSNHIPIEDTYNDMVSIYNDCNLIKNTGIYKWLFKGLDAATKNQTCNIFKIEDVFPLSKIVFEDIEASAPNNIQEYLSGINSGCYGDIMSFPPLAVQNISPIEKYRGEQTYKKLKDIEKSLEECIESAKN